MMGGLLKFVSKCSLLTNTLNRLHYLMWLTGRSALFDRIRGQQGLSLGCTPKIGSVWTLDSRKVTNVHKTYTADHLIQRCRGVQYVHCVMHKCIMVKLGGNEKHKVCKKHVNCRKLGLKFAKVGGK